jgi:hypothetical protein
VDTHRPLAIRPFCERIDHNAEVAAASPRDDPKPWMSTDKK